jgi:phthiocerol/phenolphthiocerol synthesis type-I polyketide synthase D
MSITDVTYEEILRFLTERVAGRCHVAPQEVDPDRPLADLGIASRDAVALVGELEELIGRTLPAILVYEHPTITALARELATPSHETAPVRAEAAECEIAVVGLGCRFPGGIDGPDAYWRFLLDRGDAIGEVPEGRWTDEYGPVSRLGGFLDDVAGFDARFFGITPDEADGMDPQQRLLLEVAWEALEHAGIAPASLRRSRTGVFAGISVPEYAFLAGAPDAWTTTGGALSVAAGRLSYLLDLRGPSMSVDTACSSSLVATHLAVRSLRSGESDLALAAGVNVLISPLITMTFEQAGGTASDGRCKAFDAAADGTVRSEGCGVVVLKRLGDAHRDGDRVLAVIRDTAVNSDGHSNGLVAPNPEAQEALLREVYSVLEPPDYVETHGTGTLLGDPIEARALGAVLGRKTTPLLIGSVKSNLGHLEPATGVAALVKTVLALWHRSIPPSLHFHRPNPHIDFAGLGLRVVTEQTPWPEGPGRAGVSSFGFGGTNAHVALAAAPAAPWTVRETPPVHTLLLSDVTADRVGEYAGRLADDLTDPAGAAHTLARRYGRGRFGAAVVGRDRDTLVAGLRALAAGRSHDAVVTGVATGGAPPVWVFSGYGAQRPGMARRLLTDEPAFATAIERLEPLVQAEAGFSVWESLDPAESGGPDPDPAETMITLFAIQGRARAALAVLRRRARSSDRPFHGRGGRRRRGRRAVPARRGHGHHVPGPAAGRDRRRRRHGGARAGSPPAAARRDSPGHAPDRLLHDRARRPPPGARVRRGLLGGEPAQPGPAVRGRTRGGRRRPPRLRGDLGPPPAHARADRDGRGRAGPVHAARRARGRGAGRRHRHIPHAPGRPQAHRPARPAPRRRRSP